MTALTHAGHHGAPERRPVRPQIVQPAHGVVHGKDDPAAQLVVRVEIGLDLLERVRRRRRGAGGAVGIAVRIRGAFRGEDGGGGTVASASRRYSLTRLESAGAASCTGIWTSSSGNGGRPRSARMHGIRRGNHGHLMREVQEGRRRSKGGGGGPVERRRRAGAAARNFQSIVLWPCPTWQWDRAPPPSLISAPYLGQRGPVFGALLT